MCIDSHGTQHIFKDQGQGEAEDLRGPLRSKSTFFFILLLATNKLVHVFILIVKPLVPLSCRTKAKQGRRQPIHKRGGLRHLGHVASLRHR